MDQTLDATKKIVGRMAGEISLILQGKTGPAYEPNRLSMGKITVINTDNMRVTGKKMFQKYYRHHSGYPGGLKEESLERLMARDSREVLRHAVMGMLPKNRLRARMMKNLILYKRTSV